MEPAALMLLGATVALNAGFASMAGALFTRWSLARAHPDLLRACARRLRHAGIAAALACLGGSALALWAATALMGALPLREAAGMLPAVMRDTAFGNAALAGMLVAGLLLGLLAAPRWKGGALAQGGLLMLFALARAMASHAGETGPLSLAVGVEWLHLVSVGVWLGAVGVAGWVALPAARAPAAAAGYLKALSSAATLALACIVASGAFNAWQRVGRFDLLFGNAYGLALTVKLALFAVAALLGAYNRFAGFPLTTRGRDGAALLVLRIESLVLLAALAGAAVLASLPPPR